MGWTVLYIAFGIVALWLLGEVLLQYKARLRWRLLAFAGFGCVVLGVLMPSVAVIAIGAIAFAVGQTYVTLSFRRGFSTGWAIGGSPGESRRRRGSGDREPTLEVSELETEFDGQDPRPSVYEPQPLPDDTGQYGVYGDHPQLRQEQNQSPTPEQQPAYASYDPYTDPTAYPAPGQDSYAGQDAFADQGTFAGPYDYGTGQQQYAAYSDPYIGTGSAGDSPQYAPYDGYGYGSGYDTYGQQQYATDPYAQQYAVETPPGGVWVPQQRDGEQYPPAPPEQAAPYPSGYETGHNEQYHRY
ncbi:hypothetical protein AB0L71_00665 [Streptomyces sp. NPDC052052]|uniref:hypothetical protein n=1 Tax=Streptomyces sp. NPDC052052 TaxID=3154756 RepID=UPI0034124035